METRKVRVKPFNKNIMVVLPDGLTEEQLRGEFEVLKESTDSFGTSFFLKIDPPHGFRFNIDGIDMYGWWVYERHCES